MMNNQDKKPSILFMPLLSFAAAIGIYLLLRLPVFDGQVYRLPEEHFYIVSLTSIIAAGISFAVGVSGVRLRNTQVLFVSLGFVSLSVLFSLHGLSTPGFLLGGNRVVGMAVQLAFLALAAFLLLSTIPGDNRVISPLTRHSRKLLLGWSGSLVLASVLIFFNNRLIEWLPIDSVPLNWAVASLTFTMAATASVRYWWAYQSARFPLQSGLAHAAILVSAAQVVASTGAVWHISWWFYHIILLIAVILSVFSLVKQYSFGETFSQALQGLFTQNLKARLEAGISPKVQALIAAAEAHDAYTGGHARRVALYAIRLGERLGCTPEELSALAQGSLLHDIGKLSVTDTILNKPGSLTPEERHQMEQHPLYGYEICQRLGFMKSELEIIRWHHERINGRGYPDRITTKMLPKLVQIVSVVDVYDALRSDRSYRKAMDRETALRHLQAYNGFFLDENMVNNWQEIVASDPAL
jgi:HD-GYP domain-containing protein (c-di-GMP phosphodiesterase class II)